MFSRPKILFLVSLLFVALLNPKFNPYLLFKFLIFFILVLLLQLTATYVVLLLQLSTTTEYNYCNLVQLLQLSTTTAT